MLLHCLGFGNVILTTDRCWTYLGKEDLRSYTNVSVSTLYTFNWILDQRQGKGGRKRRGIKFASSLGTYWKVYRLVYERATGCKLDGKKNRSMHRVGRPCYTPFPYSESQLFCRSCES